MNTRLIIAPFFEEPDDDRALAARAFAAAAVRRGDRVFVLCPHGQSPGAEFECDGPIELHRVNAPARNTPAGFAARAVERACEIVSREACAAIECFDAPWCTALGVLARATGAHRLRVTAVRTRWADSAMDRLADRVADQLCVCDGPARGLATRGDAPMIPVPAESGVLWMPDISGPQFVVPTPTGACARSFIISAFERAAPSIADWVLACAKGMSRWMLRPGSEAGSRQGIVGSSTVVFIAPPPDRDAPTGHERDPVACRIAIRCGHLCIVDDGSPLSGLVPTQLRERLVYQRGDAGSLARCLRAVASATLEQRAAWARDVRAMFDADAGLEPFLESRPNMSERLKPSRITIPLAMWKDIERTMNELPRRAARTEAAA